MGLDLHFGFGVHAGGQSEVADLDRHVLREEHVAQLEIAVDDAGGVHVAQSVGQLSQVEANLRLRQRLAVLHHVHQALQQQSDEFG